MLDGVLSSFASSPLVSPLLDGGMWGAGSANSLSSSSSSLATPHPSPFEGVAGRSH
eukprot:CAMPEP_0173425518 /NCGR_PEP_ID=MMETSP1357-20121228/5208_1 /TAXON_ID=77926 /ORGANISM="Hemiselmis rufescens, Strain PCC563" /LENGTH=55 /DNA_ID=CAMNT_0014388975 /DNA_START=56 /DNA_END=220 /DNA_ORIENTATION=+